MQWLAFSILLVLVFLLLQQLYLLNKRAEIALSWIANIHTDIIEINQSLNEFLEPHELEPEPYESENINPVIVTADWPE